MNIGAEMQQRADNVDKAAIGSHFQRQVIKIMDIRTSLQRLFNRSVIAFAGSYEKDHFKFGWIFTQ
jgi:hypothetical protein